MNDQLEGKKQPGATDAKTSEDGKSEHPPTGNKELPGQNEATKDGKVAREIKGNLTYSASPGAIKSVLDALIVAERPDRFSNSFLESVLGQKGGSARSVPPILKKMGFLQSDGAPTELYSKFRTDYGRPEAAYTGLRNAFSDLFKKNEFVYRVSDDQLKDYVIRDNRSEEKRCDSSLDLFKLFCGEGLHSSKFCSRKNTGWRLSGRTPTKG